MINRSMTALLMLGALFASPRMLSAADLLPGEAIGEDTVAVVWLDTAKLTGKELAATAVALLGDDGKEMVEALADLDKMRESFVKAGGKSLAIVFRGPDENGRPPEPFFLIPLTDATAADTAVEAIKAIVGKNAPVSKLTDRSLIVVPERWRPKASEPGAMHKAFEKALAAAGDSPATIVFIPNDAMRKLTGPDKANLEQMEQFIPGVGTIVQLGLQACAMKQIVATSKLGAGAKITLAAEAADADGAKLLAQRMAESGEVFGNLADTALRNDGPIVRAPAEMVRMFSMFDTLLTQVPAKVAGTTLTTEIEGKPLRESLATIVGLIKRAQEQAQRVKLANQMRQLAVAIHAYDADNGQLPDKLDDLEKYVGGADTLAKLLQHPLTGDKIGISYVKPGKRMSDIQRPHITAILFEMKDGKINATGWTGYADGHVQLNSNANPPPADRAFEKRR